MVKVRVGVGVGVGGWHLGEARRAVGPLLEHSPSPVHITLVVDAAPLAVRQPLDVHAFVPPGLRQRCGARLVGLGLAADQRAVASLVGVRLRVEG